MTEIRTQYISSGNLVPVGDFNEFLSNAHFSTGMTSISNHVELAMRHTLMQFPGGIHRTNHIISSMQNVHGDIFQSCPSMFQNEIFLQKHQINKVVAFKSGHRSGNIQIKGFLLHVIRGNLSTRPSSMKPRGGGNSLKSRQITFYAYFS